MFADQQQAAARPDVDRCPEQSSDALTRKAHKDGRGKGKSQARDEFVVSFGTNEWAGHVEPGREGRSDGGATRRGEKNVYMANEVTALKERETSRDLASA